MPLDARDALDALRARLAPLPPGLHVELEDGHVILFVRCDLLHLDADALHDRLHHWTLTSLDEKLPAASAYVSFRRAHSMAPHEEATLDLQEGWRGLEPTLALDLDVAQEKDIAPFAALVPRFLALVEKEGRPEGFREPEVGTME